jgi:hypothetical protein
MSELRLLMDSMRGHHPKCRSCVLGLRCLTGVVYDGWKPAIQCRTCGGRWVHSLRATIICHLYPVRFRDSMERCPVCRGWKDVTLIYGLQPWDIEECAVIRRKFFERRKLFRAGCRSANAER